MYDTELVGGGESAPAPTPAPAPAAEPATPTPAPADPTNQPAPAPAPAPETPPATPPEPTLYDLPDGRKVDAKTLEHEFKNNFLPDYTRKSQDLARIKSQNNTQLPPQQAPIPGQQPFQPNQASQDKPWNQPGWIPQSYGEIIAIAEQQAIERLQGNQQEQLQAQQQVTQYFDAQMTQIKAKDPTANEAEIYNHAMKYGFQDLNHAFQNLKDIQNVRMTTEQQVIKNLQSRAAEPVAGKPNATPVDDGSVDQTTINRYSSPIEMLRAIKK